MNAASTIVENQGQVDVIYFDFKKAFDTVPHNILLAKLRQYGLYGKMIEWIKSYLMGRIFRVKVAGSVSEVFSATSGVPQRSIWGPYFSFYSLMTSSIILGTKHWPLQTT